MKQDVIQPYKVYKAEEAADLLATDKRSIYEAISSEKLKAKMVGKGWKILGENLLSFMGSPSINAMQPNTHIDAPILESQVHDITHGLKGDDMMAESDIPDNDFQSVK